MEKLLVTSNFSFSHSVFKRLQLQTHKNQGLFRKGLNSSKPKELADDNLKFDEKRLNPLPNKPWFLHVCSTSLLKTLGEKEKLLGTSNFSFSHSVFYPLGDFSAIFIKLEIVVCKLFQFGSLKYIVLGKSLSFFQRGRKHCGKRRNCSLRANTPFPTVFSKTCTADL